LAEFVTLVEQVKQGMEGEISGLKERNQDILELREVMTKLNTQI